MPGLGPTTGITFMPEKRRAKRAATTASATVLTTACRVHAAVVDLSSGGAGLIGSAPPSEGQDVQLRMGGHTLFGAVAWQQENAFGVRFEHTLDHHDWSTIDAVIKQAEAEKLRSEQESAPERPVNNHPDRD